jgi:hypothetical protein
MKLVFFQAALLAVASKASESPAPEQSSIWPADWLVQTASLVDYFYPFQHEDVTSVETTLAQNANEIEGEGDAELAADADLESFVDADIDSELEADTLAKLKADSGLSNEVLN